MKGYQKSQVCLSKQVKTSEHDRLNSVEKNIMSVLDEALHDAACDKNGCRPITVTIEELVFAIGGVIHFVAKVQLGINHLEGCICIV